MMVVIVLLYEFMSLGDYLGCRHPQTRLLEHVYPSGSGKCAAVTWIAEPLEFFHATCELHVFGYNQILKQKEPARFQDANTFPDESRAIRKMVRGDTASHQVERLIFKRQDLGIYRQEGNVFGTRPKDKFTCGGQHFQGNIDSGHPPNERCKFQGGVPATGRNIQHKPAALRQRDFSQARQFGPFGVSVTGNIPVGKAAETQRMGLAVRISAGCHFSPPFSGVTLQLRVAALKKLMPGPGAQSTDVFIESTRILYKAICLARYILVKLW